MPIIPFIDTNKVLQMEILVANQNNGLDSALKEATVYFELNKIPSGKFTFSATNKDTNQKTTLPSDALKENEEIIFNIFSGKVKKTLFKGIIKSVEKVQDGNAINTKIECKDIAHELTFPTSEKETNDQSFEDKLNLFAKKLKVNSELLGKDWGKEIITHNTSTPPWDFILSYLDSIGFLVAVRNGELHAVDITKEPSSEKYLAENGTNVHSYSGKTDNSKKLKKAAIEFWDASNQEIKKIEAEQEAENPNIKVIKLNESRLSDSTLKKMVDALLKKSELNSSFGKVLTFGNLEATSGDYIKLNKLNEKLDDKLLLISKELHTIEAGLWKTEYTFGLENDQNFAEKSKKLSSNEQNDTGQTNSVNGLQIGVVTQIEEDPNSEFRIKVRIPTLSEAGEGLWARLATLSASKEMGSVFIPNVGDEVILGCLGNNPDNPIILGGLYSSAKSMPIPITKDNYIKGFVTKEGTKLILDDEKKSIEISTKKGNKLLISDDEKGFVVEDENGNKMRMNQEGISLESNSDINLKAKGNIKIEGMQNAIKAQATMELKGSVIQLN